jgi:hypothetical protein
MSWVSWLWSRKLKGGGAKSDTDDLKSEAATKSGGFFMPIPFVK